MNDYIEEQEIESLIDGEISAKDKRALMKRILESPSAMQRLEDLAYQRMLLRAWWKSRM